MADRARLIDKRLLVLLVGPLVVHREVPGRIVLHVRVRLAALVDEELRGVEIPAIAGDAEHLHQPDFDHLVPGNGVASGRAERRRDEVGVLDRDVEKRLLAGGLVVRHRGFIEVAGVVELVAAVLVHPALRSDAGGGVLRIDRARGEEIAVGLLRSGDQRDQVVDLLVERRIRLRLQRQRRGLDDLVDVGVVEAAPGIRARHLPRRLAEVVDAPGRLVLPHDVRDGHAPVDLELRRPEAVGQLDLRMPGPG